MDASDIDGDGDHNDDDGKDGEREHQSVQG